MQKIFSKSILVEKVKLYFYRYGDAWCGANVEACKQTWTRLEGIKISVGIAEQGDISLIGMLQNIFYFQPPILEPLTLKHRCQELVLKFLLNSQML